MAWRDRLRRRAAGPDPADRSRGTERAETGEESGDGPDRSVSGAPGPSVPSALGPSVPGDWDGGWRRTAPPELTVARAPLGVSDGLAFRARLAAWQNPSFDAGLGHALLPTAPTGLVRGVTTPAAPQPTRSGGGPLLLRALRPEGAENGPGGGTPGAAAVNGGLVDAGTADSGAVDGGARLPVTRTPDVSRRTRPGARQSGPASSTAQVSAAGHGPESATPHPGGRRRNSTTGKGRSGEVPRTRGLTSTESPAALLPSGTPVQRAAESGTGPVVPPSGTARPLAAPPIPLVRRVSVVQGVGAGAGADGAVARSASGGRASQTPSGTTGPGSGRASRSPAGSGSGTSSGPAVQRTSTGPQSARRGGQPEASRASGAEATREAVRLRPLGPLPTAARHPAGPVRRLPALRAAAIGPNLGTAPDVQGPASTTTAPAASGARSTAPAQRAISRAPLGAPLSELPSTASPLAADAPAPSSVLGAGAATVPGPALPVVQRHSEGDGGTSAPYNGGMTGTAPGAPDGPANRADAPRRTPGRRAGARARGGLGAPMSELPPSVDLPGSAASGARAPRTSSGPDVQRAPARPVRSSGDSPAPTTTDRDRTRTGPAPLVAPLAQAGSGPDAPLLGAADVQRRVASNSGAGDVQRVLDDRSSISGTTLPGATAPAHGGGPATPLVTQSQAAAPRRLAPEGADGTAANTRRPGTTPATAHGATPGTAPGATSDGSGSDRQRPDTPATPAPVVVARAPAARAARPAGTTGARTAGTAGPHPLTVIRAGAHSAPVPPRTLSLLAARPLRLNTRAPEGVAAPAVSRSGGRPVVAARWPGAPAAHRSGPAQPSPGPSAVAPPTPRGRRTATEHPGPGPQGHGARTTGSQDSVQRVPVVRPAAPPRGAPRKAVPVRPLPVTAPQSQSFTGRPPVTPAPGPSPAGTVPVVRPRTGTPGPVPAAGGTGRAAPPVQRDVTGAGDIAVPKGVPAKAVPERPAATSSAPVRSAARHVETPQDQAADLDDLARRLLDPMARLLRTELRRGRDRTGRPYDGRR